MQTSTQPLAKAITTLEGQLVVALNVVIGVASVPAIHALNPKVGAIVLGVQNVAFIAQRALIKVKALNVPGLIDQGDNVGEILAAIEGETAGDPEISASPDFKMQAEGGDIPAAGA